MSAPDCKAAVDTYFSILILVYIGTASLIVVLVLSVCEGTWRRGCLRRTVRWRRQMASPSACIAFSWSSTAAFSGAL